jgi:hypothetical protein
LGAAASSGQRTGNGPVSQRRIVNQEPVKRRSQLFTLRVWVEDVGNGRSEIRGTLKHVLTGETNHFRDWGTLTKHLEAAWTQDAFKERAS